MNAIIEQINSVGKTFVDFSLPMLIQSSVLIIIVLVIDMLLRKKVRAVFRYWIWMIVLVKLVLPPTLSLPTTPAYWFGQEINNQELQESEVQIPEESPTYTFSNLEITPPSNNFVSTVYEPEPAFTSEEPIATPTIESEISLSWQGLSFLAWLVLSLIMLILLIQRSFFVKWLINQSQFADDKLNNILEQARVQMGLKKKIEIKLSDRALSPSVCGLFKTVILIPKNLVKQIYTNDMKAILLHEMAHIKRHDLWINLIQAILQIIYIYNPLLWIANIVIRNVREQAVDEMVLVAMGEQAEEYPKTLLNISRLSFGSAALSLRLIGVAESKKALFSRIKHITSKPFPKTVKLGVTGLITLIIAASVLLPMAKGQRETVNASEEFIDKLANDVINENSGSEPNDLSETKLPESEVAWRAQYSDIRDYVKLQEAGELYQQGIEMFDVNDLPILYELLKDDDYAPYWDNMAGLIGFLSDKPKIEESVTNLLDYFQRDDGNKNYSLSGKIRSISMIGLIGGDLADSILRKAVTIEGARELAKNWIDNEESWPDEILKQHPELATSGIQLAALKGLAYSGTRENLDYLEKLYLEEKNASNPSQDFGYRENLVSAMAEKDYLEEHDIGACILFFGSDNLDPIIPYWEKFSFPSPEEDSAEDEWEAKYSDAREFVKLEQLEYSNLYDVCRDLIGKDQLPLLYDLLKDEEYAPYWHNVAQVISFISDDPDSVPVLLEYFQRDEGSKVHHMLGKIDTIMWMGLIGGDIVDSVLRKAVTREGAIELAGNWIKDEEWTDKNLEQEVLIGFIQSCAMQGLVFTRKPENIKIVEELYYNEKNRIIEEKSGRISGYLVDAMIMNAYIADHNEDIESYFSRPMVYDRNDPYRNKYSYSYPEEDSAEAIPESKYNEVTEFIKRDGPQNQVRYGETRKLITKDKLPILYELLDDDEYALYWHKVVAAIGFVSDDPESVNVLLKFLQRNDIYKVDFHSVMGKPYALTMIGLIGGDTADYILRISVTKEGAEELAKEWIDEKPLPGPGGVITKQQMIKHIQSQSILGLAFSGKPENLALLEKMYNENKEISIKNHEDTEIMSILIHAMALKDIFVEIGFDAYMDLNTNYSMSVIAPYLERYRSPLNEENSTTEFSYEYIQISGVIKDPSGNPIANAQVALSNNEIGVLFKNGKLENGQYGDKSRIVQTDSQGKFNLGKRPAGEFHLIAAHDKGFAFVEFNDLSVSYDIQLQSWGRIEGQVAQSRVVSGNNIWMSSLPNTTWFVNQRDYRYETKCDMEGRFVFEKVPPGWFEVGYLILINNSASGSLTSRTPVQVKAGETSNMTLSGEGQPVTGKFVAPQGFNKTLFFLECVTSLQTVSPEQPRPDNYEQMTDKQKQIWYNEWRKSEQYQAYIDEYWHDENWRCYSFFINDDGSFRIEDVIPGKYKFYVTLLKESGIEREEYGGYYGTIELPQLDEINSDKPFDLGELELKIYDSN